MLRKAKVPSRPSVSLSFRVKLFETSRVADTAQLCSYHGPPESACEPCRSALARDALCHSINYRLT